MRFKTNTWTGHFDAEMVMRCGFDDLTQLGYMSSIIIFVFSNLYACQYSESDDNVYIYICIYIMSVCMYTQYV